MIPVAIVLLGVVVAVMVVVASMQLPHRGVRGAAQIFASGVFLAAIVLSSIRHISADEIGIVVKNIGGKSLQGGDYIAVDGEQGIQADVLSPGWKFWYWPVIYDVREVPMITIKANEVGLIEATDGLPLDAGQLFAPEYPQEDFKRMVEDARYFLTTGKGRKGAQASVLTTGKYRLNTELFKVKSVPITEVAQSEVAVLKANFGKTPSLVVENANVAPIAGQTSSSVAATHFRLAREDEMGVRATVLTPGKYAINTDAYTVVDLWTSQMVAQFTKSRAATPQYDKKSGEVVPHAAEEREITVRTTDGFTFPVDVRVEYHINPNDAPIVVETLGDDEGERFRNALNSAVRAIFRNNAEKINALDYVQQRSHQEEQSARMLTDQMRRYGVSVTAVRIGDIGDEQTLGALLKTQTDRELAKQELITFQEQQKTAEEQKRLNKAKQESEEERRLATAAYGAKIAEETAKQKITEAEAEAKAITIRAKAQSDAYQLIAQQIGKSNAAMLELMKIVGERNINIAPRVMVIGDRSGGSGGESSGSGNGSGGGETTALIGTMLDTLISREEAESSPPSSSVPATKTVKKEH